MKKNTFDLKLKESDIAFIGVAATIVLYIMNVLGTGVIVGGDVGHIDTEIPFYGFIAPIIFIVFAAFIGYYTKRNAMAKAFKAIYITLLLPFAAYPTVMLFTGTPFIILPMYIAMPVGSLHYYLHDNLCELLGYKSYECPLWLLALIIVALILPLVVAPIVYRFTKEKDD